jgi:RNAse (barnase) inhibitor barstar
MVPLRTSAGGGRLPNKSREYILDGTRITSLEAFYEEVSRILIPGAWWGQNLNAFDDILRGGFGTPVEGFVLRWQHSEVSRASLGYPETVRQLERRLVHCHPANREEVQAELDRANHNDGPTVFDWLVEIICDHGNGGDQSESNVLLILD